MPKLKTHLLPRIKIWLSTQKSRSHDASSLPGAMNLPLDEPDADHIIFKYDRLYRHNIMRVNYTTYDIRRKQDTFNPKTPHRDIMVLADNDDNSLHPFLYARILGIFHVNVIYTGPGSFDFRPQRFNFLWVRWFESDAEAPPGDWAHCALDQILFPPVAGKDAFGFLDPGDVMRGCHIIPAFAKKKCFADGRGLSRCAMDSGDWHRYYVNRYVPVPPVVREIFINTTPTRFVDRDMLMRFHWGLAVGHVYAHGLPSLDPSVRWVYNNNLRGEPDPPICTDGGDIGSMPSGHDNVSEYRLSTNGLPQDDHPEHDEPNPPSADSDVEAGNDGDSAPEGLGGTDNSNGEESDLGEGEDKQDSDDTSETEEDLLMHHEMYVDTVSDDEDLY